VVESTFAGVDVLVVRRPRMRRGDFGIWRGMCSRSRTALQRELGVVEPSTRLRQLARRGREFAFELSNRRLGCDRLETALDQLDKRLGEAETALCGARRLCLSESGTLA
jgi:hypothetical protein